MTSIFDPSMLSSSVPNTQWIMNILLQHWMLLPSNQLHADVSSAKPLITRRLTTPFPHSLF